MRLLSCSCLLSLVLLIPFSNICAAQVTRVEKDMVWSLPENEISSPQFSADGSFVVLVTRVHWPDGEEAENLSDSFFKGLADQRAKDPRFADPVIRLIDSGGNTVCEARYGTNPVVSPDNKKIAFSRQKKPISGLRPLAETMAGNDIQIFDCEKKETVTLAQPDNGYLDDPIFLRTENRLSTPRTKRPTAR
jgi:WD40 repeat protein